MFVKLTALADAANVSREGKLNLLGIFDTIGAHSFPVTHPSMVFAFRLLFEYEDQNKEYKLQVSLIDQDGRVLWNASARISIDRVKPGQFAHSDQLVELKGVTFQGPGRYRMRVRIEGHEEPHDTVFQLVAIQAKPEGG